MTDAAGLEEVFARYDEIETCRSTGPNHQDLDSIRSELRNRVRGFTWRVMTAEAAAWSLDSLPAIREAACALGGAALQATQVLGPVPDDDRAPITDSLRRFQEEDLKNEEALARSAVEERVGPRCQAVSTVGAPLMLPMGIDELVAASHEVVACCAWLMVATDEAA